MIKAIETVDGDHVVVGDAHFTWRYPLGPDAEGRLPVLKDQAVLGEYEALCRSLEPRRIVELGIHRGGSTAFLNELAEPDKIVAVELATEAPSALRDYIASRGLDEVVRPHYGVDQSDRARLRAIVQSEFGDEPLDLVVDDASHLYGPTRSSFETLFPLLRPGGAYVIEDWTTGTGMADAMADLSPAQQAELAAMIASHDGEIRAESPVSRLAHELVLARSSVGAADVIGSVTVTQWWIVVRRGADPVDADAFRLDDHLHDTFALLRPAPDTA